MGGAGAGAGMGMGMGMPMGMPGGIMGAGLKLMTGMGGAPPMGGAAMGGAMGAGLMLMGGIIGAGLMLIGCHTHITGQNSTYRQVRRCPTPPISQTQHLQMQHSPSVHTASTSHPFTPPRPWVDMHPRNMCGGWSRRAAANSVHAGMQNSMYTIYAPAMSAPFLPALSIDSHARTMLPCARRRNHVE